MGSIEDINLKDAPPFEDGGIWQNPFNDQGWRHFRVGTCEGAYRYESTGYEILAISNSRPGNGHVEAALAWFFASCKRDRKALIIRECSNAKFAAKLTQLGFTYKTSTDMVKSF